MSQSLPLAQEGQASEKPLREESPSVQFLTRTRATLQARPLPQALYPSCPATIPAADIIAQISYGAAV